MKASVLFVMLVAMVGLSYGVCTAQPECANVYLRIYDPVSDPPCGDNASITTSWSIRVTSCPTSISAGSCSSFALDNLYTDVEFYAGTGCGVNYQFTCDIVATGSDLSGYYPVTAESGGCITVCETCAP